MIPEEKTETPASVLESIKLSEPEKPAAEVKKDEEDDDPFEGILRMFRDKK